MLYLKSLEVENVRCFGNKQQVDFTDERGNISQWTVILGDNGSGKTTLLRSIVSLLPTPQSFFGKRTDSDAEYDLSIYNEWRNAWDLKHKNGELNSKLTLIVAECTEPFQNIEVEEPLLYTLNHKESNRDNYFQATHFSTKNLSPVFCFAYGANRKMAEKSLSGDNFNNTGDTLFIDNALLQNSSEYFLRLDYETAKSRKGSDELNRVKELLLKVLPEGVQDIQVVKTGKLQREVQAKTAFGWVNLNDLGLGYKTAIAWLIDFATKMIFYYEKSETPFDEPAILILDEIDLHMHPAWQRGIIENLTKIFTKTQFIVTAHSPLIAQAALNSKLVLLKRADDHVKVINEPDIIKDWRIDQILTSDLFGIKSARSKETEIKLERRKKLLKKISLNREEENELELLNKEIYSMPVGDTKEEINAMSILRNFTEKLEAAKKENDYDQD
ncbi:MAG: AAA family ATPase [Dysgonamonadaceae bacterium]|jgi:predicted ATP-binding protein involved in virulence|nr:AAA family ATPase [Dysgonamonadaceae bacterium]